MIIELANGTHVEIPKDSFCGLRYQCIINNRYYVQVKSLYSIEELEITKQSYIALNEEINGYPTKRNHKK